MRFKPETPHWDHIRPVTLLPQDISVDASVARVQTSEGILEISLIEDSLRLQFRRPSTRDYDLMPGWRTPSPIFVDKEAKTSIIENDNLSLRLYTDGEALSFDLAEKSGPKFLASSTDGHFARRFRLPPFARISEGWLVNLDLPSSDKVYGLGEKWGSLNRRGQLIHSFNQDALGVNAEASYKNSPVAWSSGGWGLIVHTPSPVVHAVGYAPWSHRSYGLLVEDDALDIVLFRAPTAKDFLKRFSELCGRAPVPPKWSTGVILSRAYYQTADELLSTAREVRKRNMPCDTITLDGRAWQDTRTRFSFDWCPDRYPDPEPVLDELKRLDFKICIWEYPMVSVENHNFDEFERKGWFLKEPKSQRAYRYQWDLSPFGKVLTPLPESGIIDFTHPEAYAYWKNRHKELFDLGVDMIKADFGEQVVEDVVAHNGASGRELHNVYSLLYNRCVYEAAEEFSKNGPFLFSRSSWLGCHRYPSQWGGDPQADWEGLAASIRGGLSWGLSGGPYYATDVGGFYGDRRDPVLYVRWLQASIYSAHVRLHGIGQREPWSYGGEAEAAAIKALQQRYRLLPYLERVMEESHQEGLPVQRAMSLACPDEPQAWEFDTQFFFGADLLVAPCLREDGKVEVYLPKGEWVRFPDGRQLYSGGNVYRLSLNLDEDCVFVQSGVSVPLGPSVEHTGQLFGGI